MTQTRDFFGNAPGLPDDWKQMTWQKKRKFRQDTFVSTEGKKFVSPEAEKGYKLRAQRLVDVINVKVPDMVPVSLPIGNLPLAMAGLNTHDSMYNPEKAMEAYAKFNAKYSKELDTYAMGMGMPGKVMDVLGYKMYSWPGHGLPMDADGFQFIEGEYMMADEYDDLIRDPADFWLRTYFPRKFKAFEGFSQFQSFTNINEIVHLGMLSPLGSPAMQDGLQRLLDAGKEYNRAAQITGKYMGLSVANGFPAMGSIFCKAPYDTLSDTLRGTRGVIKDIYTQPDKVLKALDVIADMTIANTIKSPNFARAVLAGYPLHKGADGWMSQKQFDKFYWPSMKKVMNALIKEGLVQRLFAEGGYNTRLESVKGFPKGMVTWHFDQTDMQKAKEVLGAECCIQGNIPAATVITGTPKQVKDYCRELIQTVGKGGGFILTSGAVGNGASLENLRAIMEAVREYGVYRK